MNNLQPKRVFKYFEEIAAIPHGSGNMDRISAYCMNFAEKQGLEAVRDKANNVIIYKNGSKGYENAEPVILQGHLDMVCQKEADYNIDFEKDGLTLFVDGDFLKAKGTTLGADNAIAVAMIMAILEADDIAHPPIEAVFTTDEEIGMIGAGKLDFKNLSAKRMINLDAEETKNVTVSCAGGSDFEMKVYLEREKTSGTLAEIEISGLLGGHSGIEINSNRVNSNILMARILNSVSKKTDFEIVEICGGEKGNAIPLYTRAVLVTKEKETLEKTAKDVLEEIKEEIADREPGFDFQIKTGQDGEYNVICKPCTKKIIFMLLMAPNGVCEMSATIENLVQTSLNLGILKTDEKTMTLYFALRSNKQSALLALEEKMFAFAECVECEKKASGHYPPWEYKENSILQEIYCEKHFERFGFQANTVAIHAGLECGVFASAIKNFDCIAFGPDTFDVHTVKERLSIESTKQTYGLLLDILKELK